MLFRRVLGTLIAATFVGLASLLVGQAVLDLTGETSWSWLAPALGLATLIVLASLAVRLPGGGHVSLAVLVLVAGAAAVRLRRRARRPRGVGVVVGAITLLGTGIPFLANGRVGLLGVSFNNDLAVHLAWAEHLRSPALAGLYDLPPGYPLGPHALVASIGAVGIGTDLTFVGLLIAVPIVTALAALSALEDVPRPLRIMVAPLVGLAYLTAAYYAQGAFKETIQALLVLTFALALRGALERFETAGARAAVPLGLLAAACVYNYSYYGLGWLLATTGIWVALEAVAGRPRLRLSTLLRDRRLLLSPALVASAVVLVALLPELPRVLALFEELSLSPAAEGAIAVDNIGNLAGPISSFEAFGLWPRDDFRFSPPDLFRGGMLAAVGLGVAIFGGLWWLRRRDLSVPAAVASCALVYLTVREGGESAYVVAKALVVPAPLIMLMGGRALLQGRALLRDSGLVRLGVASVFVGGAGWSSFLALESALVGPREHGAELGSLRPLLEGRDTLFLGYDDFFAWQLRGVPVSNPATFSRVSPVLLRPEKPWAYGEPFDFDSVQPRYLDRFDFVVATRTSYASRPPSNFRWVRDTASYRVWRRQGPTTPRAVLSEDPAPGATLDCSSPEGKELSRRAGRAGVTGTPVVGKGPASLGSGRSASIALDLPPGDWDVSLQYTSPHALSVSSPGGRTAKLPANLDRPGPFWPLGPVRSAGGNAGLTVSVASAPLLRPPSHVASIGAVVAMPRAAPEVVSLRRACGRYVDWYELDT